MKRIISSLALAFLILCVSCEITTQQSLPITTQEDKNDIKIIFDEYRKNQECYQALLDEIMDGLNINQSSNQYI